MKTKRLLSMVLVLTMLVSVFTNVSIASAQTDSKTLLDTIIDNSTQKAIENLESYDRVRENGTEITDADIATITRSDTENLYGAPAYIVADPDDNSNNILKVIKQPYRHNSNTDNDKPASANYVVKTFNAVCDSEYIVYSHRMKLANAHTRMMLNLNYKSKLNGGLNPEGTAQATWSSDYNLSVNFRTSDMLDEGANNANMGVPRDAYIGKWVTYTLVIDAFDWTFDVYVDDTYYYTGSFVNNVPDKTANYISGIAFSKVAFDRSANASATPDTAVDLVSYYDDFQVRSISAEQAYNADVEYGTAVPGDTVASGLMLDKTTLITGADITWTTDVNEGVTLDNNNVVYIDSSKTGKQVTITATVGYNTGDYTKTYTPTVTTAPITDLSGLFDVYKNNAAYVEAVYDASVNQMKPSSSDYKDIQNNGLYAHTNQHVAKLGLATVNSDGYTPTSHNMYLYTRSEVESNSITYYPYNDTAFKVDDKNTHDVTTYNYFGNADNRVRIEQSTDKNGVTKAAWTNYKYFRNTKPGSQQMVFGIDDGGNYITTSDSDLTILVEYLDLASGNLSMTYWANHDQNDTTDTSKHNRITVHNKCMTGSGEWKTAMFRITDALFTEYSDSTVSSTGMCDGKVDFNLVAQAGTDGKIAISRVMVIKTADLQTDVMPEVSQYISNETTLPVTTANLKFPVTWQSNNANVTVDANTGKVTVAKTSAETPYYEGVVLTAKYGSQQQTYTVYAGIPQKYVEYKFGEKEDYQYGKIISNGVEAGMYKWSETSGSVNNPISYLGAKTTRYYTADDVNATANTAASSEVTWSQYEAYTGEKKRSFDGYFDVHKNTGHTGDSTHNRVVIGPEGDKRAAWQGAIMFVEDKRLNSRVKTSYAYFRTADGNFTTDDKLIVFEIDWLDNSTSGIQLTYRSTGSLNSVNITEGCDGSDVWRTLKYTAENADLTEKAGTSLYNHKANLRISGRANNQYANFSGIRIYTPGYTELVAKGVLTKPAYTTYSLTSAPVTNVDGYLKAQADVTTEQAKDAKLYIAIYDHAGDLVGVATSDNITDEKAQTIVTDVTNGKHTPKVTTFKTFLWDSDLKPIE